jgi:hypothetical protein
MPGTIAGAEDCYENLPSVGLIEEHRRLIEKEVAPVGVL